MTTVRLATRGSALARWQANHVAESLVARHPDLTVELVVVSTEGDRHRDVPLSVLGGKGVFVKEIQAALVDGRADVAVHSAKDLPGVTPDELVIAAVPDRADPRDGLVGLPLDEIPEGGQVATGSRRRAAQLLGLRPDLDMVGLRGNIETRVAKAKEHHAVVVAVAALDRLDMADQLVDIFEPDVFVPQVGQGSLAIECRADDDAVRALLAELDHAPSRRRFAAERSFLVELGGDCDLPAGAYAEVDPRGPADQLHLTAVLADDRGLRRVELRGSDGPALGATAGAHPEQRHMTVYLVGAGPGDPGLITVRGAELLTRCDVVVHDRLSARELLELTPAGTERIDVGKAPGRPSMPQDDINQLLVARGLAGQTVVRLKGGDPYVFARGGEEAAALAEAGVAYEVVPGISSAMAVPAAGGIPVTRRYSSTSLTIVTGHEDPAKGDGSVDWEAIAKVGGTIVVLMGAERIGSIAARLQSGGLAPTTPVAAIRWGTRPDQVTIRSTLGDIGTVGVRAPSTIVIGDVAGERLDWFERRPLFGVRVVNPRAREQASELTTKLAELGAEVIELASIAIEEPSDGGAALAGAVERLTDFDWVVLTSANGARRFLAAVGDGRRLGSVRLAAIGPGTAAVLADHFVTADLIPSSYVAESLVEAFPAGPGRVLLARAQVARDVLPDGLAAKGWDVEVVEAYRTVTPPADAATLDAVASAHVVAFTASSTVTRFLEIAGADRLPRCVAAIGPITAATARAAGVDVAVVADIHSLDGLVEAIADAVGHR